MDFFIVSGVHSFILNIAIGFFVYEKKPRQKSNQIFALFSVAVGCWSIGSFLANVITNAHLALVALRSTYLFAVWAPALFMHFIYVLSDSLNQITEKKLRASYSLSFIFFVLVFTPWFIPKFQLISNANFRISFPGPAYYLFFFFFIFATSEVLLCSYSYYKRSRGNFKTQAKYLVVANVLALLAGFEYFSRVFGLIQMPPFDDYILVIYFFVLAYSIICVGLFDIEELAQAAHRDKLTAIGVLAASINHEVKNPLFIIKGFAEGWLERKKDGVFKDKDQAIEKGEDAMRRSIEQADRAMDIIKRLSLFAKAGIDSEIKFEAVSIQAVLEDILPLVRYELAANNITLTRDIPKDLPEIQADRRYLEEILFNLIVNAIQAIKNAGELGEIKVTAKTVIASREDGEAISGTRSPRLENGFAMTKQSVIARSHAEDGATRQSPAEQGMVIITIQDNGPGIPEEKIKDVFRPFYTTKAEGTGLGLYITQQLVEKIKGQIEVQSELGVGTTFTVAMSC